MTGPVGTPAAAPQADEAGGWEDGTVLGRVLTGRLASGPRKAMLILLALVPLLQLGVVGTKELIEADPATDATAYWLATERIRNDAPLYEHMPAAPHVPGQGAPYLYPPFFAAALSLVPVEQTTFIRLFLLLGFACFWVYAACLARLSTGRVTPWTVLIWGALLMATIGAQGAVSAGQAEPIVWALFGLALVAPVFRGFGFAAAALIKLYAVWPLALAIWLGRWRAYLGTGAAAVAAALIGVVALGADGTVIACLDWFVYVYPSLAQGQFAFGLPDAAGAAANPVIAYLGNGNLSLGFLPLQVAHQAGYLDAGPLPQWARVYLMAAGIGAPLLSFYLFRRRSPALRYAAAMCAAALFGPIFRSTYAPILFTMLAAWIAERREAAIKDKKSQWTLEPMPDRPAMVTGTWWR